jgi:hypothetical protein
MTSSGPSGSARIEDMDLIEGKGVKKRIGAQKEETLHTSLDFAKHKEHGA